MEPSIIPFADKGGLEEDRDYKEISAVLNDLKSGPENMQNVVKIGKPKFAKKDVALEPKDYTKALQQDLDRLKNLVRSWRARWPPRSTHVPSVRLTKEARDEVYQLHRLAPLDESMDNEHYRDALKLSMERLEKLVRQPPLYQHKGTWEPRNAESDEREEVH
jgi:hypothetical protein